MNIAITIVHNKTDAQNEAQIQALLPLIEQVEDVHDQFDEQGNVIGQYSTYHYELKGLNLSHEVRFYQVIPFGVTNPPSLDLLDSHKVFYGPEDAQRSETRFFNWGLKRGIDHGADVSLYLSDPTQLTALKLRNAAAKLASDTGIVETAWGKIATKELLSKIGQLNERKSWNQAISDLKTRISTGGLKTE